MAQVVMVFLQMRTASARVLLTDWILAVRKCCQRYRIARTRDALIRADASRVRIRQRGVTLGDVAVSRPGWRRGLAFCARKEWRASYVAAGAARA
jgi:hypothetical protein